MRLAAWAPAPQIPQERHAAHLSRGGGGGAAEPGSEVGREFNGAIIHHGGETPVMKKGMAVQGSTLECKTQNCEREAVCVCV